MAANQHDNDIYDIKDATNKHNDEDKRQKRKIEILWNKLFTDVVF